MNLKVCRKHKNLERSTKKDDSTANIPIRESLRNMGKLSEIGECLEKHYHVAYHIALRGCQYTDLVHELEVQKLHKVEFFKSSSYENESVCREFINFCSKSLFNQTVKEKHQKTITILCDRSTDSAVVEKECIYVLFADPEIFHSTISFFPPKDRPSEDAEGIFSVLKKAYADEGLDHLLRKIVFLVADGVSVNSGIKKGLFWSYKKRNSMGGFHMVFFTSPRVSTGTSK